MKILICTSKHFYGRVKEIKNYLEKQEHKITLPNSFDAPMKEEEMKRIGRKEHQNWKSNMMKEQYSKIKKNDAILVLNFKKIIF